MISDELETTWAEVRARWDDESAHAALLHRFPDLDGLTEIGRRYRAVLHERPDDPVALRWRDEIVRRATVVAMSQLPRTRPPEKGSKRLRTLFLSALFAASMYGVVWLWRVAHGRLGP